MYNELTAKVAKQGESLVLPLSAELASMLRLQEGSPVSLTVLDNRVEIRSLNYSVGESSFENLSGANEIMDRFGRHFGGPTGEEVLIAEKDYLCLFNHSKIVALMKYDHAVKDWLAGYDTKYQELEHLDIEEVRENKLFVMRVRNGLPDFVADEFITYHAILVLEGLMIMGHGARVFYPEDGPYPLVITDAEKDWSVLIRPRLNWDMAPPGVKRPEVKVEPAEEEKEEDEGGTEAAPENETGEPEREEKERGEKETEGPPEDEMEEAERGEDEAEESTEGEEDEPEEEGAEEDEDDMTDDETVEGEEED